MCVAVLPITHEPSDPAHAIEIPLPTKRRLVLRAPCKQAKAWLDSGSPIPIAANLPVRQFLGQAVSAHRESVSRDWIASRSSSAECGFTRVFVRRKSRTGEDRPSQSHAVNVSASFR
jgi:hypothetical protein